MGFRQVFPVCIFTFKQVWYSIQAKTIHTHRAPKVHDLIYLFLHQRVIVIQIVLMMQKAVGAVSFCSLGIALSAAIPSEQAAPPITNVMVLPLYFLSGVFIPESEIPEGVLNVADVFPIRHFFEAFLKAWDPATVGSGFAWGDLAFVAAWGAVGFALAIRFFRWTPRGS